MNIPGFSPYSGTQVGANAAAEQDEANQLARVQSKPKPQNPINLKSYQARVDRIAEISRLRKIRDNEIEKRREVMVALGEYFDKLNERCTVLARKFIATRKPAVLDELVRLWVLRGVVGSEIQQFIGNLALGEEQGELAKHGDLVRAGLAGIDRAIDETRAEIVTTDAQRSEQEGAPAHSTAALSELDRMQALLGQGGGLTTLLTLAGKGAA